METNKPYVKMYDKNGEVKNPIQGSYLHKLENRMMRREKRNTHRFMGCSKSIPLTVVGSVKYRRLIQPEFDKDGNLKLIYHYLPR